MEPNRLLLFILILVLPACSMIRTPEPSRTDPIAKSTPIPSQSQERLEFEAGITSINRSGDLPAGGVKEYVLSAPANTSLHVQTVGYEAPVEFIITSPADDTWSGEPQPSDAYIFTTQVILPEDGDYVIRLSVPSDKGTTRYDVAFTISKISTPAIPPPG